MTIRAFQLFNEWKTLEPKGQFTTRVGESSTDNWIDQIKNKNESKLKNSFIPY